MSNPDLHALQAASFGQAADAYERGRPGYPPEALDWLLPPGAKRVLDLGAGTGKLTRQLTERGLDVVAVDPSEGMLEQLRSVLADVPALVGNAERIPLEDGAVDAVLVAQAWHWVDPARAVPEVARVLSPGGRIGLVWNMRDRTEDWVAQLGQIMRGGVRHELENPPVGTPFGPLERFEVRWSYELNLDALLDLVTSRSYIIGLSDAERAALLDTVRALAAEHPALAGKERFSMPYVTQCFRAHV
jgi:SAM-dependent methyltransferase